MLISNEKTPTNSVAEEMSEKDVILYGSRLTFMDMDVTRREISIFELLDFLSSIKINPSSNSQIQSRTLYLRASGVDRPENRNKELVKRIKRMINFDGERKF